MNEDKERRELSRERVKERKEIQLGKLMRDIQTHSIIQSKDLAFRLRALANMLKDKDKSELVSVELTVLSDELIKIAEQGEDKNVTRK